MTERMPVIRPPRAQPSLVASWYNALGFSKPGTGWDPQAESYRVPPKACRSPEYPDPGRPGLAEKIAEFLTPPEAEPEAGS